MRYDVETVVEKKVLALINPKTVDNERLFTKWQVIHAREAVELQRRLGFPANSSIKKFIDSGAMLNVPTTTIDVDRAEDMYGKSIPFLQGKSNKHKSESVVVVPKRRYTDASITLHVDIMFVEGLIFLVSVGVPGDVVMITHMDSRSERDISKAMKQQLSLYQRYEVVVNFVSADNEKAIDNACISIGGPPVIVRASGKKDGHVEVVIKHIKEAVRCIVASIPYNLSKFLLVWLVKYAVYTKNLIPTSTNYQGVSAREFLTGVKPDYKRDLKVGFGDFCQVIERDTDNTLRPRTVSAVALLPTGNLSDQLSSYH
jgi:hypothetical protein